MVRHLLETTSQRAANYLEQLDQRLVRPEAEAVAGLAAFDEPLPSDPTAPEAVLAMMDEIGSPATMAMAGPRFFGFVIGGSLPVTLAANWLASAWDQNSALYNVTPATARLEQVALRWLIELFGLPENCSGAFVTGATVANFTALAAARHAVLERAGWNVEADGLFGAPPITVVVGQEAHPTLIKSLGLLGLGRNRVVRVPVDGQGRMRADALPALTGPTIVCVQAGNVNTGAFDPIGAICQQAHTDGAWVHVDGAFGLWAAVRRHCAFGRWHAASKLLGHRRTQMVKRPLRQRLGLCARCSGPAVPRWPSPPTICPRIARTAILPTTRRSCHDAVAGWRSGLHSRAGTLGLAEMIERCCRHARRFADGLSAAGYAVLNDVVLNQVLVSFGDAETTQRVIAAIQADGTCWCGGTVWQGHTAMRISVSSWATTEDDVERSLKAMLRIATSIAP